MKDYFDSDYSFDVNYNIDSDSTFVMNNLFGELILSSDKEMEISEKISHTSSLQKKYYHVYDNKKGILKKKVRKSLNELIIDFSKLHKDIKLYELILYLIFNIHDRILKYINEEVKDLLREELKDYVG